MTKHTHPDAVDLTEFASAQPKAPPKYGLPREIKFCSRCVISNQRPNSAVEFKHTKESRKATIAFDADNICDACRVAEEKYDTIDWGEREGKLNELLDRFRSRTGHYDCVVPGSGGKDSFYAAHMLKFKYGMHPLTVTWAPHIYTDWGWRNFQRWIHAGFDNLLATPNGIGMYMRVGEGAAAEAGALDVFRLQVDGKGVDPGRVGKHQHGQVLVVDGGGFLRGHARAFLGERLARIGTQAQGRDTDQGEVAHALLEFGGHQARDMPPEGKARQPQRRYAAEQVIQSPDDDVGDGYGNPGLGRHRRVAEAWNIRHPQFVVPGQLRDVADPVGPGPRAAMEQHERFARAPDPPDHGAIAGWGADLAGRAVQRIDGGGGVAWWQCRDVILHCCRNDPVVLHHARTGFASATGGCSRPRRRACLPQAGAGMAGEP